MGSGVPLLNEYKQEFLWKRLPQTILGGPKLRLGYEAPCYVYLSQVVLFLVPWTLDAIFTPLVHFGALNYDVGIYVVGALSFVFSLLVNGGGACLRRQQAAVASLAPTSQNVLAEEDEVEFTGCCGVATVSFVAPGRRLAANVLLHALLSAALGGLGFWYLLPATLTGLYGELLGAVLVVHLLGWFTLAVAQYSLVVAAPPEPATYAADDTYELAPLTRPFYCLVCFSIDLLARFYTSDLFLTNQVVHGLFVGLPLLWTLGLLSPLEAFFPWLLEQALVILFGGSPMASDLRTMVMVVASVGAYLAVYFIPHGLVTVILMACLGYLLSVDIGQLLSQFWQLACHRFYKPEANEVLIDDGFLWRWSPSVAIFHLVMTAAAGGLAAAVTLYLNEPVAAQNDYLAYTALGLLVLDYVMTDCQSVYVLLGLWRNRLYPTNAQRTTIYHKSKQRLKVVGYLRRGLRNFVAPLVIVAWLARTVPITNSADTSSSSSTNTTGTNTSSIAATLLGANRAYRWAWQSTVHCLADVVVFQLVDLALPSARVLSSGVRLLVISLLRDRLTEVAHKLYVAVVFLITSWTDKKQRRASTIPTIVVNALFLPVLLAIIAMAAALSAPLLPLFTLPVFFVGYPRARRGWPGTVGSSANTCPDTVYYRHLAPQLVRALRVAAAEGSIGEVVVGAHYLARFQDRLAWVQVLERGYLYLVVSVKGLELQETSCHTVEAARIDDVFEAAFELSGRGNSWCLWTHYPLSVLRPYDAVYLRTYSDARNQLTGVIDSPDSLRLVADGFVQALVWLLLHHCRDKKRRGEIYLARPSTGRTSLPPLGDGGKDGPETAGKWETFDEEKPRGVSAPRGRERKSSLSLADEWTLDGELEDGGGGVQEERKRSSHRAGRGMSGKIRPTSSHSRRTTSLKSLSDSWASDNESLILEPLEQRARPNLVIGLQNQQQRQQGSQRTMSGRTAAVGPNAIVRDETESATVLPPLREDSHRQRRVRLPGLLGDDMDTNGDTDDDFLNEHDFGLPAVDIGLSRRPPTESHVSYGSRVTGKSDPRTPAQIRIAALGDSLHFNTIHARLVSPPMHWREAPVERRQLEPLLDRFPKAWYRHVLGTLHLVDEASGNIDVAPEIAKDTALEDLYRRFVMACYAIVNVLGSGGITDVVSLGPTHVHKVYSGDIPWSPSSSWLQEDDELYTIVVKAFRYGVKLAIDQVLLGEISSLEELQTYLEEYDQDYYIGLETDPAWAEAILESRPNLFSLNYVPTQGTFTSRVLSLQDLVVHVGSVNQEAVRAQWANLALELLYMTNDDEERNSIQAHAALLRNLCVQAADPPLGYPVYASRPVSIPTL